MVCSCIIHTSIIEKGLIDVVFLQGLMHNKRIEIPDFVQNGLAQNVKMNRKKTFHRSLQTMQLLLMYRCKYTSIAHIESRGLYNFCETLLVFEDPEAKDRMRNKREIDIYKCLFFSTQSDRGVDECRTEHQIKNITSNYL